MHSKLIRWTGLFSVALMTACGGGGGGSSSDPAVTAAAPTYGRAVDPYIAGAKFVEVAPDGRRIQYAQTLTDTEGRFEFQNPLQDGSEVVMLSDTRGTHVGVPFEGLLRRKIQGGETEIVVSPLTTLLATGAAPLDVVAALDSVGLPGLTPEDLIRDPMASLDEGATQVSDDTLRLLQANMAVHAMLVVTDGYNVPVGASPLAVVSSIDPQVLGNTAAAVKQTLSADSLRAVAGELATDADLEGTEVTLGDVIRASVDINRTVAEQYRQDMQGGTGASFNLGSVMRNRMAEFVARVRDHIRERTPAAPGQGGNTAGQGIYDANCAECHKLGTYDAAGSPDLAGKSGNIAAKLAGGHMRISLSPEQVQDLTAWVANPTAAPAPTPAPGPGPGPGPAPTPTPAPGPAPAADGKAVYDGKCAGCHRMGSYDASGSPDLSSKGGLVAAKFAGGHRGVSLTPADIQAVASWLNGSSPAPAPAPTPVPTPAPTPVDGKTIYTNECAGCHTVGSFDTDGNVDLAGKGSALATKFQSAHKGISLSAADRERLAAWLDSQAPAPAPAPTPTPTPAPADGKALYDGRCAGCHKLGTYDADGSPDLAGKGGNIAGKLAGGHMGISLTTADRDALVDFVNSGSPAPAPGPAPQPTPTDCAACHGQPPATGAHIAHRALPSFACAACHQGASHDGKVNVALAGAYSAKTGAAVKNSDGTCSNVSCHGGKTTPAWSRGTIDVNTECLSCHASGTGQYNGYVSGKHSKHARVATCTDCHDIVKLAANHFKRLETTTMEGPASGTLKSFYNGSSCTVTCHGEKHEGDRWR